MGNRIKKWWNPNRPDDRNGGPTLPREPQTGPKSVKIVLVGDTAVGKSCLIINYMNEQFDENYEPSVLDVFKGSMTFK